MLKGRSAHSQASWAELPVEILDQILFRCDTPTLLSLGKLNHTLNRLALEQLFERENVTSPKHGYLVSRLAPNEVVPALNAALWITHLHQITYFLNPDVTRLFNEVKGITNLMARMPTNDRLDLYFSTVDAWFTNLASSTTEGQAVHVPAVAWRNIFVTMLETALRKGCTSISVEGGHRLEAQYVDYPPSKDVLHMPTQVNSVTSESPDSDLEEHGTAINQANNPGALQPSPQPAHSLQPVLKHEDTIPHETPVVSFATTSPSLTAFNLHSSMMMQPLFFPHTINLIQSQSPVLRRLEIVGIKVDAPIWEKFFTSLALPVLQDFVYLYDTLIVEEPFLTPRLLLSFFTRHPKLLSIRLYGVCTASEFPPVDPHLLPHLKSLNAHPRIVSWLLQHQTSCPDLSFISLTSENLTSLYPYSTFDMGIVTIASLDRPFHVQFRFSTEGDLQDWFLAHINAGATEGSPLQQLTKITKFTISASHRMHFHEGMKGVIPQWLKLLPGLKILEMIDLPYPAALKDEVFVRAVKEALPGLKGWVVGWDRVFWREDVEEN